MTVPDLNEHTQDWSEIFYGVIPEDMLRMCYIKAEQNEDRHINDRNFPLRRREVLDAYYRIKSFQMLPERYRLQCQFCELHTSDPVSYRPCSFHQDHIKDQVSENVTLQPGAGNPVIN